MKRFLRGLGVDIVRYPAGTRAGTQLANLLGDIVPDLLVDIGAHRGDFAARCRALGYRGRIIAFDPTAESNNELQRRSRADHDWTVLPLALGNRSEETDFYVAEDPVLNSLLPPSTAGIAEYASLDRTQSVPVRVVRLDEVLPEVAPAAERVLLKTDTQGFDMHVLEGAVGVLDRVAAVHIELSLQRFYEGAPDYLDVLAWLRERGLEPVDIEPGAMHAGLLAEIDCLLRRS